MRFGEPAEKLQSARAHLIQIKTPLISQMKKPRKGMVQWLAQRHARSSWESQDWEPSLLLPSPAFRLPHHGARSWAWRRKHMPTVIIDKDVMTTNDTEAHTQYFFRILLSYWAISLNPLAVIATCVYDDFSYYRGPGIFHVYHCPYCHSPCIMHRQLTFLPKVSSFSFPPNLLFLYSYFGFFWLDNHPSA